MDNQFSSYSVRRMTTADAAQIPTLANQVNGPAYIHDEVYHPERMMQLNGAGRLISVVAIDDQQRVVGHCALERPNLELVPEIGEAMVLKEHRHHHLLDLMRQELEAEGQREALFAITGNAVTHHVFSQMSEERGGGRPIGFMLAASPPTAMRVDYPQRISLLSYLKFLEQSPPAATIHVPDHHRAILGRIYQQAGRQFVHGAPAPAAGAGTLKASVDHASARAHIKVTRPGRDSVAQILATRDSLSAAEVVYAELPLADPGCAQICRQLEERGAFFLGLASGEPEEGDSLRLNLRAPRIDPDLIKLNSDFARELLAYIVAERKRLEARAGA